jgi:hypothetical protein
VKRKDRENVQTTGVWFGTGTQGSKASRLEGPKEEPKPLMLRTIKTTVPPNPKPILSERLVASPADALAWVRCLAQRPIERSSQPIDSSAAASNVRVEAAAADTRGSAPPEAASTASTPARANGGVPDSRAREAGLQMRGMRLRGENSMPGIESTGGIVTNSDTNIAAMNKFHAMGYAELVSGLEARKAQTLVSHLRTDWRNEVLGVRVTAAREALQVQCSI